LKKTIQGHQGGELTDNGKLQAQKVGERLMNEVWTEVYSSDLHRTMQTVEIICSLNPSVKEVKPDPRLREKGGGVLEGMPLNTFKKEADKARQPQRKFRPPKGESWNDVM